MDPLRDYFDGLRDAPVPARLLAETPPEAFLRKLTVNCAWAAAGLALVLAVSAMPTRTDRPMAEVTARQLVALQTEVRR